MSIWIEAALNGPWTRERQPLIPITVEEVVAEGIACAKAGAAIIHVHAVDPATGRQNDDPDTYAAIIEGIRGKVDAIVYPTLPFVQSAEAFAAGAAEARYRAVETLGGRGLMEWGVVDPGTINLATFEEIGAGGVGSVYANPGSHVRRGLELAARHRYVPSYAVYEPGFLRLGAAMARTVPDCPAPLYRFMFSRLFTYGFPPETWALDAYLRLLEDEAPEARWMVAGLGVDIRPLAADVAARGGHVRVGLEDAPFGTEIGNVAWVEDAAARIERAGYRIASTAEVRADLSAAPAEVTTGRDRWPSSR